MLGDDFATPGKTKRVLLCSGKIYYDLKEEQLKNKRKDVAIVRIEQLFPFPEIQVDDELDRFKKADVFWVQEEPSNMGYWAFVLRSYLNKELKLISRKPSASPATGYHKLHEQEQKDIIDKAFDI